MNTNILYYGDNLEILRKYIPDNSIDLIYLDPPFNSKATYNILFKEPTGEPSQAQITAFEDTWHWGAEAEQTFQEIVDTAPANVIEMVRAFRSFIGRNDMMAYLVMMCIRLLELKRVLKGSGSIYLHCDPTASHYLKLVMDTVFGKAGFRSELIWCFTGREMNTQQWNKKHNTVFFYTKGNRWTFNWQVVAEEPAPEVVAQYKHTDEFGRRYVIRSKSGSKGLSKEGADTYRQYYKEVPPRDWKYIKFVSSSHERLPFPTQKPEELLERIIGASSNEGDIVLDPFCGCGTTLVVAHRLKRKWIGIDITHLAISTMKWRLEQMFPSIKYKVIGEPVDLAGAKELANQNKYQFQWWALSLIGGRPYGDKKKGADTGIDGYLYFIDEKDKVKKAIVQVKSGGVSVSQIRDLIGVVEREKAEMGIFLTLEPATKPMETEAVSQGFYKSPLGQDYPKMQILTIEELLKRKKLDIPSWVSPVQAPPLSKKREGKAVKML